MWVQKLRKIHVKDKYWDVACLVIIVVYLSSLGVLSPYQYFGDCPVHAWISKRTWDSGNAVSYFDFVVDANGTKMPINYPLLFHTALALSNTFSSNFALNFEVFALAFSAALALAFYTFGRFLFGRMYAFVGLVVLLGSSQLLTLSIIVFMEPFLFTFIVLGLFCLFRFLKSHETKFLYLFAFFIAASLATKQSVFVILISLLLWLTLLKRNDVKQVIFSKRIVTTLFLIVLIASPFLFYQISTTGTLTYPPEGPVLGFISQKIFHLIPKLNEDPRASEYITVSMGHENYVKWLLQDAKRTNRLFYPFNLNDLGIIYAVFFVLLFLGFVFSIKNRREFLAFFLLLVAVSSYFIVTEGANPRYYLLIFLLTIPILSLSIGTAKKIHKILPFLFIAFLVFSSAATYYDNIAHVDSLSRAYMETGYFSWDYRYYSIQAYERLSELNATGLVLSGQWPETMLYGNVTVTWMSPFGGSEYIDLFSTTDRNLIDSIIKRHNIQYVVVNRMDRYQTWYGPLRDYEFYDMLEKGLYGEKVYNNSWVSIYDVSP